VQLPVATTTETIPDKKTKKALEDSSRPPDQKQETTPSALGPQKPGGKLLWLDKLFQE
jgi:hypothetical protein